MVNSLVGVGSSQGGDTDGSHRGGAENASPVGRIPDRNEDVSDVTRMKGWSKDRLLLQAGLTPEEFLLELVDEADGRLQQQRLVEFTGWSSSTVSRYLCRMEENERIRRLQIGNGKMVFLPEKVPAGARSPFEGLDGAVTSDGTQGRNAGRSY